MLILCKTLSAMASPDIVSSIRQTKYFALECSLIYISPYFMLSVLLIFILHLEAKSIDFVLSSPK